MDVSLDGWLCDPPTLNDGLMGRGSDSRMPKSGDFRWFGFLGARWTSFVSCGLVVVSLLNGCGATGDEALPVDSVHNCAPVKSQIATVLHLIETGQLAGLREIVETEVDADLRRSVLELAFDVIGALPTEIWPPLLEWVDSDGAQDVMVMLGGLLRFIDGDVDGLSRYYLAEPLRNVVGVCVDIETLKWVQQLLNDKHVMDALNVIVDNPTEVIELVEGLGIDFGKDSSKTAVLSLLTGMLTSIATPGFTAEPILNLFYAVLANGIVDADDPAVASFLFLLERIFETPTETQTISELVACVQLFDQQNYLVELLYDLLSQNAISLQMVQGVLADVEPLVSVLDAFLRLFVASPDSWSALQTLVVKLLTPTVAPKAIPDLATLIETNALTEVVSLLGSLAVGCSP